MYSVEKVPGKEPLTRTESLVLTRLPPRTEATAYQYSGLVSEVLVRGMPVTPCGRGVTPAERVQGQPVLRG